MTSNLPGWFLFEHNGERFWMDAGRFLPYKGYATLFDMMTEARHWVEWCAGRPFEDEARLRRALRSALREMEEHGEAESADGGGAWRRSA